MVDTDAKSGWLLAMMALVLASVIGFGTVYINWRVAESEQRDCDTLRADISALEEGGSLTASGARLTISRRTRYAQIGCEPILESPKFVITSSPPVASPAPSTKERK